MVNLLSKLSSANKNILQEIGRKFGLEIKLSSKNSREDLRLSAFLKDIGVDMVLDVGANRGQFAKKLFEAGYLDRIVSFEPIPNAHELLRDAAERHGSSWSVAPRVALSDRSGVAQFHVTAADTASSFFPIKKSFAASVPQAQSAELIDVPTARLDDIVAEMGLQISNCFLKMDVQGAETLVMAGAPNVLSASKGLMAELSLAPLYEGQSSTRSLLDVVYEAGFEIWDVWPGYRDPRNYRLLQVDIICFKRGLEGIAQE